jgi:hypothetical protein
MLDASPLHLVHLPVPPYNPGTGVHTAPGGYPAAYSTTRCYRIFGRHVMPHRGCLLR